jgi:uncharacterized protein
LVRAALSAPRTVDSPTAGPTLLGLRGRGPALTLYLDASALVKAFLSEAGSDDVLEALAAEGPVATSRIAFVECHAAFARGRGEGRLTSGQVSAASKALDQRWQDLLVVELDEALSRTAAELTHAHRLRAGDAIHLASALTVAAGAPAGTSFASWDARLWDAASRMGLHVTPHARPA